MSKNEIEVKVSFDDNEISHIVEKKVKREINRVVEEEIVGVVSRILNQKYGYSLAHFIEEKAEEYFTEDIKKLIQKNCKSLWETRFQEKIAEDYFGRPTFENTEEANEFFRGIQFAKIQDDIAEGLEEKIIERSGEYLAERFLYGKFDANRRNKLADAILEAINEKGETNG